MQTKEQKDGQRVIFTYIVIVLGFITVSVATPLQGQEAKFPSKPIEIIVPFPPGGSVDVGARIISEFLSKELKVPVIIRNQAGGGGLIASAAFLKANPDGYTILAATGAISTTVLLSKTPPFDPRKDLLPVGYIADTPIAMAVSKASPFKSFGDFLQFAKNNPGKLIGGVANLGAEDHMMFNAIVMDAGIKTRLVPFQSGGALVTALMGGHADWISSSLPRVLPFERSGDVRVLLLTRPSKELPGVSSGPDLGVPSFSSAIWIGIFVLPQTPKAVYNRLVSAVKMVTEAPEIAKKLVDAGFNVAYKDPQEFSAFINTQWEISSRIIKETGMKVN